MDKRYLIKNLCTNINLVLLEYVTKCEHFMTIFSVCIVAVHATLFENKVHFRVVNYEFDIPTKVLIPSLIHNISSLLMYDIDVAGLIWNSFVNTCDVCVLNLGLDGNLIVQLLDWYEIASDHMKLAFYCIHCHLL